MIFAAAADDVRAWFGVLVCLCNVVPGLFFRTVAGLIVAGGADIYGLFRCGKGFCWYPHAFGLVVGVIGIVVVAAAARIFVGCREYLYIAV